MAGRSPVEAGIGRLPAGVVSPAVCGLVAGWRARAAELRRYGAAPAAVTLEAAADELGAALRSEADELLTLTAASAESGFSVDHLARLLRERRIPNAGRKGAPRIRRSDLPRKASVVAESRATPYDVGADARSLLTRRVTHGGEHGTQA
jgi:hypothetical protein